MAGREGELLLEIRKTFKDRIGWKCLGLCEKILSQCTTDSSKPAACLEDLEANSKSILLLLDNQLHQKSSTVPIQEVLYCAGISLLRVGFHKQAKKVLEALSDGGELEAAVKVGLELCNFVEKSIESTKHISDNDRTPVGLGSLKVDWCESMNSLTFCVYAKQAAPESIKVKASENLLAIFVALRNNISLLYDLPFLAREIVPESIDINTTAHRIEIKVKKKVPNATWGHLHASTGIPAVVAKLFDGYPGSLDRPAPLYNKESFWEEEFKKLDEEGPSEADSVNAMFKKIFDNATEDGKKAMLKSFVESSGTCLSTNWGEVSKKKVDIVPPEGTTPKKFSD